VTDRIIMLIDTTSNIPTARLNSKGIIMVLLVKAGKILSICGAYNFAIVFLLSHLYIKEEALRLPHQS